MRPIKDILHGRRIDIRAWLIKKLAGNDAVIINAYLWCPEEYTALYLDGHGRMIMGEVLEAKDRAATMIGINVDMNLMSFRPEKETTGQIQMTVDDHPEIARGAKFNARLSSKDRA